MAAKHAQHEAQHGRRAVREPPALHICQQAQCLRNMCTCTTSHACQGGDKRFPWADDEQCVPAESHRKRAPPACLRIRILRRTALSSIVCHRVNAEVDGCNRRSNRDTLWTHQAGASNSSVGKTIGRYHTALQIAVLATDDAGCTWHAPRDIYAQR